MREKRGICWHQMTFCNSSLNVMNDNGDDDENNNKYDNEVDHDDCILCAYCRLVGGDAHMIIYIKCPIFTELFLKLLLLWDVHCLRQYKYKFILCP